MNKAISKNKGFFNVSRQLIPLKTFSGESGYFWVFLAAISAFIFYNMQL
jgi:hypothetical protein